MPTTELLPDTPFLLHLRFRVPLWRITRGTVRIEAALTALEVDAVLIDQALADDLFVTVSLPAGTVREALRGAEPTAHALRAARRLAEMLWDLDPVLVPGSSS
ncbi:hypothetical protein JOF53_000023 [Crossiella equi]|uniref:Uncharacterized protein n=1 Tax=Crossiella equi TaxID=130796 RepID=A0ABS5A3J3_9PSEU|nr:hypothetical protein [Crossiella equi]MBP2471151.1 hypothetical protein [Crossiella equi]